MPQLSRLAANVALDSLGISFISLHTGYAPDGLESEVFGGAPPYARIPVTFNPASNGRVTVATPDDTHALVFDVPPNTTVYWLGLWLADNTTFAGMLPIGNNIAVPFALGDDMMTCYCPGHLFGDGYQVVPWNPLGGLTSLPVTPDFMAIGEGGIYYIINPTPTSVQLSDTSGGPPIVFGRSGSGFLQTITPVAFASQGTFPVFNIIFDAAAGA
jgi:hypothetical protein